MKSNPVKISRPVFAPISGPILGPILGLSLFAGWLAVLLASLLAMAPARAEDAPANCEVPAYLLTSESPLSKVEAAVVGERKLDVLVVGSRSSTISASEANAYPGRLQAMLKEAFARIPTTPALGNAS